MSHSENGRLKCLLIVFAIVFVAGCGGGGGQTGDQVAQSAQQSASPADLTSVDACALLTAEEIQAATGHAPAPGVDPAASITGAAPICAWASADGTVFQVVQLLVSPATPGTFEEYRDRMAAQQIPIARIDGPGRFTASIEGANMIQSMGDRFMVQVMVEPVEGKDRVAAATSLSEAALRRLE